MRCGGLFPSVLRPPGTKPVCSCVLPGAEVVQVFLRVLGEACGSHSSATNLKRTDCYRLFTRTAKTVIALNQGLNAGKHAIQQVRLQVRHGLMLSEIVRMQRVRLKDCKVKHNNAVGSYRGLGALPEPHACNADKPCHMHSESGVC